MEELENSLEGQETLESESDDAIFERLVEKSKLRLKTQNFEEKEVP